jgi:hypothetical protein
MGDSDASSDPEDFEYIPEGSIEYSHCMYVRMYGLVAFFDVAGLNSK